MNPNQTIDEVYNDIIQYMELKIDNNHSIEYHKACIMLFNSKNLFKQLL